MSYYSTSGLGSTAALALAGAFGAVDFNSSTIWADCQAGGSGNNAAGKRCGQAIQAGLNQLGYGPLAVDGQIGSGTIAAIKRFSNENGLGPLTWPTQAMVIKMEQLLKAGSAPGPSKPVSYDVIDGQYVPTTSSGVTGKFASMSTGGKIAVVAAAVIGIGALAMMAKRKKSGSGSSMPSRTMIPARV